MEPDTGEIRYQSTYERSVGCPPRMTFLVADAFIAAHRVRRLSGPVEHMSAEHESRSAITCQSFAFCSYKELATSSFVALVRFRTAWHTPVHARQYLLSTGTFRPNLGCVCVRRSSRDQTLPRPLIGIDAALVILIVVSCRLFQRDLHFNSHPSLRHP